MHVASRDLSLRRKMQLFEKYAQCVLLHLQTSLHRANINKTNGHETQQSNPGGIK